MSKICIPLIGHFFLFLVWPRLADSSHHQNFSKLWNRLKNFKGYRKKTTLVARWMQHVEDRPEDYQPFTQLGFHYTWSRLGGLMWNVKLHTWYEFQTSPEMLPDKRCWLMTSSLNRLLLSRRYTGESFMLLPSLNPKIGHGPCLSL